MNTTYETFLIQLLEAIEYAEDQEKFVDEFIKNVRLKSLLNLMETLPEEQQTVMQETLTQATKPEDVEQLLTTSFTNEQRKEAFNQAAQAEIQLFLQSLQPTLTDTQRQKLLELFQKLSPTPQA